MKKLLLSLFVLLCFSIFAMAQNRTINGKVISKEDNLPLPGVSVRVVGTQIGTSTNATGDYTLSVPQNATLEISILGYKTQRIPLGSGSVVNVSLDIDNMSLDEVVITGAYGTKQTARSTAYSAQVVNAEQLNTVRQTNVNNALAGKVAGIQVRSQSAAALGRSTVVRLRGATGFSNGNDGALYIVDGTILPNIDDLNIDDIEDLTVLQGAASSAQFGSQGANGAIVITTKKGRVSDGIGVNFNLGTIIDKAYILPNYQNTYAGGASSELMQYNWKVGDPIEWKALDGKYHHDYSDDASWGPKMVGQEYIPWYAWYGGTEYSYKTTSLTPQPNNAKDYFETGITYNNGVTFTKSAENFNIRTTYNNQKTQGLIPSSGLLKNNFSLNANYDLNKHFTISANVNYTKTQLRGEIDDAYSSQSTGSFNQWFHRNLDMNIMEELRGLRTPEGIYASWNHANPAAYSASNPKAFYAANYWYNFYTYYDLIDRLDQRDRLYGNLALTYKLNDDIKFNLTYRKQQNMVFRDFRYSSQLNNSGNQTSGNNALVKGYYNTYNSFSNRENLEFMATYDKKINDFSINANLGSDFFSSRQHVTGAATVNGLSVDDLYTIANSVDQAAVTNSRVKEKYRAIFGKAVIGYKNMLFANIVLRNDWFSTLPKASNSILSKSFGGSFVFSDLLPEETKNWLHEAKMRFSYGEIPQALGTDATNFGAYRYPGGLYGVNANKWNGGILMSTPDQYVDPDIKGTVSRMSEFGLDLAFFKRRLTINTSYYWASDKGIPYTLSVNGSTGYTSILTNIGEIKRKGIEIEASGNPIRNSDFNWTIRGTFARVLNNEVVEISKKYNISTINVEGVWGTTMPYLMHKEGMQWGQLYGNGIKRNEDGLPVIKANGGYANDKVHFGSVLPMYTGGLQNSFSYKDFSLNFNIDYSYGGKFVSLSNMFGTYSGLTARTAALNDKGVPVRDPVAEGGGVRVVGVDEAGKPVDRYVEAQTYFQGSNNNNTYDDFVYDLTFVKLRELSLGYNIPVKKFSGLNKFVKSANFSVVGRNLWLMYATTKDFDPSEVSATVGETAQLPGTRGIGFNLRIGF